MEVMLTALRLRGESLNVSDSILAISNVDSHSTLFSSVDLRSAMLWGDFLPSDTNAKECSSRCSNDIQEAYIAISHSYTYQSPTISRQIRANSCTDSSMHCYGLRLGSPR